MTGSDIFSDNGKDDPNHQTRIHYHQDQVLVSSSVVLFLRIQVMVNDNDVLCNGYWFCSKAKYLSAVKRM